MKTLLGQRLLLLPVIVLAAAVIWTLGLPFYHWLRLLVPIPGWLFGLIWLAPALSLSLSYMLSGETLRTWLHRVGECWFGLALYLIMAFALRALLLWLVTALGGEVPGSWRIRSGWLALAAFAACYIWGVVNALRIHTREIKIELPLERPLRLVLFSDLHLGFFTGPRMLPRIVSAVLKKEPDGALLAGDIFDMAYDDLRQPEQKRSVLAGLSRQIPVFACGGNHDLLYPDPRKEAFICGSGIRLLADESAVWNGVTILGRRDAMDERRLPPDKVYPVLPADQSLLVLEHNPRAWREAWDQGADLVVSGHTHGGQTFPGNLLQKLLMRYPIYGHRQEQGRHLVVTSGAGFWGPPLRVGVNNEIVVLQLTPRSDDNRKTV